MKVIQGLFTSENTTLLTDKFQMKFCLWWCVPRQQWCSYLHLTNIVWLTRSAVTDLTAWFWSFSLEYISRSGTHGFSSATRLSNVATSRQLCTHEQIQDHHSTNLLKQRYKKPLIQSIPFHYIFFQHLISPCSIQGIH